MKNSLEEQIDKAVEIINKFPKSTRIRVISHYDADGTTAAAIICKTLQRAGYDFHASLMRNPFDKGLERISKEENKLIIFSDMGSGQIETIEKLKSKIIIIDHHQHLKKKTSENVLQINANLHDINGNYEACGSTLALSLAKTLDPKNIDLAPLAIIGMTGDKQYIGGIKGYNKEIVDEALKKGIIQEENGIKLTDGTLYDALFYSVDPYYTGLSGNKKNVDELLEKLDIKKDITIEELDDKKRKKLQSFLMLKLIRKGCEKNILDTVIRPRYKSDNIPFELERFADLIDSCGKGGNRGLGLAICMDDKEALDQALKNEKEYKQSILDELIILEKEGAKEKKIYRYFYSKDSSIGGVISGIATNFIFDKKKPLISIVHKNDELHISCRGNQDLVEKGLDLGSAMKKSAEKLNGHGGGHAIAAGATIKSDQEEEFLELVDNILSQQIK